MTEENKQINRGGSKAIVNAAVRSYGEEPFFVKKANKSKQFLEKHGLPKPLKRRSGSA